MIRLTYFREQEFRHPQRMDAAFLRWLDAVRYCARVPFHLTSDARTPEENARVGGATNSLHLRGRAVDFVPLPWDARSLWAIVRAVTTVPTPDDVGVELELVQGPQDRHVHVGLFSDTQASRVLLALD